MLRNLSLVLIATFVASPSLAKCPSGTVRGEEIERRFRVVNWEGEERQVCKAYGPTNNYKCGKIEYEAHVSGAMLVKSKSGEAFAFSVHSVPSEKQYQGNAPFDMPVKKSFYKSEKNQSIEQSLHTKRYGRKDYPLYFQVTTVDQVIAPCTKLSF